MKKSRQQTKRPNKHLVFVAFLLAIACFSPSQHHKKTSESYKEAFSWLATTASQSKDFYLQTKTTLEKAPIAYQVSIILLALGATAITTSLLYLALMTKAPPQPTISRDNIPDPLEEFYSIDEWLKYMKQEDNDSYSTEVIEYDYDDQAPPPSPPLQRMRSLALSVALASSLTSSLASSLVSLQRAIRRSSRFLKRKFSPNVRPPAIGIQRAMV